MQEFMDTYKNNIEDIENFLIETIKNSSDLALKEGSNFEKMYEVFPSLELVYICDKESFIQTSPNIYRNQTTQTQVGSSRKYLLSKLNIDDKCITVSQPYISSATGKTCIAILEQTSDYQRLEKYAVARQKSAGATSSFKGF